VLNVRLYIQVNVLTSVADELITLNNKHNFEPIEKILPEKLDDLKGAEARYSKDLTLCQAKVNEFQISGSIIVFSAWSACLFKSQNVFLTVFLSSSISFCSF
jgi:hypothetical protein